MSQQRLTPQSGILPAASTDATFITYLIEPSPASASIVRSVLSAVPALTGEVGRLDPSAGLVSTVGLGSEAWDCLFPSARPRDLRPFKALDGLGGVAPASPADLFVHLRSDRRDLCYELSRRLRDRFGQAVSTVEEVQGFRYLDSRDLTGFVDGTENPTGDDRARVALVGDEDADFAGGSYVAVQRYRHDLVAWEQLPVAEQEQIIARTKPDNVEFATADKPLTAHIKRAQAKKDGESLEILRHSMPYGSASEQGLYFVAYAASPDNFDLMLESMVIGDGEGHFDHLLRYTTAVTGASFFVPSRDWLEANPG